MDLLQLRQKYQKPKEAYEKKDHLLNQEQFLPQP